VRTALPRPVPLRTAGCPRLNPARFMWTSSFGLIRFLPRTRLPGQIPVTAPPVTPVSLPSKYGNSFHSPRLFSMSFFASNPGDLIGGILGMPPLVWFKSAPRPNPDLLLFSLVLAPRPLFSPRDGFPPPTFLGGQALSHLHWISVRCRKVDDFVHLSADRSVPIIETRHGRALIIYALPASAYPLRVVHVQFPPQSNPFLIIFQFH